MGRRRCVKAVVARGVVRLCAHGGCVRNASGRRQTCHTCVVADEHHAEDQGQHLREARCGVSGKMHVEAYLYGCQRPRVRE